MNFKEPPTPQLNNDLLEVIERTMYLSNNFLSDKAHSFYKYLKYTKLTGKREYVRREMKGCRTSCVYITELSIKQVSSRKCNR